MRLLSSLPILCTFTAAIWSPAFGTGTGVCDLSGTAMTFKQKCKDNSCQVSSVTFTALNAGTGDANCTVSFYLSNDAALAFPPAPADSNGDKLIQTVSLGKIKAAANKKRTLGGGLLKQANAVAGQYIIAVVNTTQDCGETNTANNTYSALIPFPPQ